MSLKLALMSCIKNGNISLYPQQWTKLSKNTKRVGFHLISMIHLLFTCFLRLVAPGKEHCCHWNDDFCFERNKGNTQRSTAVLKTKNFECLRSTEINTERDYYLVIKKPKNLIPDNHTVIEFYRDNQLFDAFSCLRGDIFPEIEMPVNATVFIQLTNEHQYNKATREIYSFCLGNFLLILSLCLVKFFNN